jgi:hypothetical protein
MYSVRNFYSRKAWHAWRRKAPDLSAHCLEETRDDTDDDTRTWFDAVHTFDELAERVAFLQLMNKRHVLYFRGLKKDYGNDLPSIFRTLPKSGRGRELRRRLAVLRRQAGVWRETLVEAGMHPRQRTLQHYPETIWAVQQHYKDALEDAGLSEAASSPYLDVTQSLRVAATFATDRRGGEVRELKYEPALLKVVALPQTTGSITYSADEQLQMLRLSALCPPGARRPLVQEAHLVARFPMPSDDTLCDWLGNGELERFMSLRRRTVAVIPIEPDRNGTFREFWGRFGTPSKELIRCPWFGQHKKQIVSKLKAATRTNRR